MIREDIKISSDYLNVVHHVTGDLKVIEYLRRGSQLMNERLFFLAKRDGQTNFFVGDKEYLLVRQRDGGFVIQPVEEADGTGTPIV